MILKRAVHGLIRLSSWTRRGLHPLASVSEARSALPELFGMRLRGGPAGRLVSRLNLALLFAISGCTPTSDAPPVSGPASRVETATAPAWFEPVVESGVDFVNVSGQQDQLPILDQNGQGAAVLDIDDDGRLDLLFVNGSTLAGLTSGEPAGHRLYRNLGGWRFTDVTASSGIRAPRWGTGAAVADVDGDGRDDLLLTGWTPTAGPGGSVALYLARGGGHFEDVTRAWGLAGVAGYATGATLFDADGDGRLDLFVARYVDFDPTNLPSVEADGSPCLYRGVASGCGPWTYRPQPSLLLLQRGGQFVDISRQAGITGPAADRCRAFQPVAVDLDGDADRDLYVGCDVGPNLLFENRSRDGRVLFVERGTELGAAFDASGNAQSGMGITVLTGASGTFASALLVTNFAGESNTLYVPGGAGFRDATSGSGLEAHPKEMGWGVAAEDFDGNGVEDVIVVNGHIYPQVTALNDPADAWEQPIRLYRGLGNYRWEEQPGAGGLGGSPPRNRRAALVADLDNDGRPDLVTTTHLGSPELFRNVVPRPVRRRASPSEAIAAVRNQGFQSARDPRRFLGWALSAEDSESERGGLSR